MFRLYRAPAYGAALCFILFLAHVSKAWGQAYPTALRPVDVTVFAGATAAYTGLSAGRNKSVTAGIDLNLPESGWLRPSLEVRATAPYDRGLVDAQKSVLGGVRVEAYFGRAHPYVNFLAGRGRMTFNRPYTLPDTGALVYSQPDSTVLSPGAGIRVDLTRNLAVFGDVQVQHWSTPVSLSGHLFPKPVTAGLVYRFAYTHRGGPGR